jgi:hypothetical protein
MPIFYVTALTNKQGVKDAVKKQDPGAYELRDDSWFLKFDGTTHGLGEALGINTAAVGTGIVLPVTNYSGRASADLWEWLRLRMTATSP